MNLELYNAAYSTCSQKVRLCLHEKGLSFTDRILDFRTQEHLSDSYLRINPNGVVPTLIADGRAVIDSSVIIEFLDEVFPETALTPKDPFARADMRAWLRYIEEVPTKAIRFPSFQKVFLRHFSDMDADQFDAAAQSRPLRTAFYRKMGRDGFDDAEMDAAYAELRQTVMRMATRLTQGPWLCGAALTLADYCVTPTIDRMADLGMASLWDDLPEVADWYARIQARPAFVATFYAGSRVSDRYDDLQKEKP
jgi:glutathione S-transferase